LRQYEQRYISLNASEYLYYIDTGLGIHLKGAGIDILWDEILEMALLGSVIFGMGMWRFQKQFV